MRQKPYYIIIQYGDHFDVLKAINYFKLADQNLYIIHEPQTPFKR